ncbi:dual specificity protein phosphatase 3-like [Lineus longissimus]|uniref:dual specificity protein phosphatase 3-like n=1 Tax=Lineus longissimus TaxID=88925 RepID=UPI002B4CACEB
MADRKCTAADLEAITSVTSSASNSDSCDEVYPNVFLSSRRIAKDRESLKKLGITHVFNAAQGPEPQYVDTDAEYYENDGIKFQGLPGEEDGPGYQLCQHFEKTADFMQEALDSGGKVLVHCIMGRSRSPTLVLAYLMKKHGMTAEEALKTVKENRDICPNAGFLQQLCDLNEKL